MKRKKGEQRENSSDLTNSILNDKNYIEFRAVYEKLKLRYNKTDILASLEKEEFFIPVSIFNAELSSLEAISKYLHENKGFALKKISNLLNRSGRNIWNSYSRSKIKFPKRLVVSESELIPISILKNLDFTLFENIVACLKDKLGHSYHEIGALLHRNERTIWTVYNNYKKKKVSNMQKEAVK
ncbi:hypothetical protein HYV80_06710 [Candidatus Woesearchaeota archaeon]|nr:hypothetical protein [Candidatus Woesearchaeota archaeon]